MASRQPRVRESPRVQNEGVIEASRRPGILAQMVGSMLQKAREVVGWSYDEAAARLGREADWLVRVETGFAVPGADEVARLLVEYGVRDASLADEVIDLARRAASPPPWLAPHVPRLSADARDVLLIEAESTLAQVYGFLLIPQLAQAEGYFREIARHSLDEDDPDQEWDLLIHRQEHRPAGVTRLLEVIIDETALEQVRVPQVMAGQLRHLLELAGSPHATVRVIPKGAAFWEQRGGNFDILSFAGTSDRMSVIHYPIIGAQIARTDAAWDVWTRVETSLAAGPDESRAILERHLTAHS